MTGRAAWAAWACLLATAPAAAQGKVDPRDRTAIEECLERVGRDKTGKAEDCIGIVESPCIDRSDASTASMNECSARETAVWDERLNVIYRKIIAGDLGKLRTQRVEGRGPAKNVTGADILRDAQRAWIAFRDRKCDAAGLSMEGGSGASLLSNACYLQETARQALWLQSLDEER